jgi:hypothetical protein
VCDLFKVNEVSWTHLNKYGKIVGGGKKDESLLYYNINTGFFSEA